MASSNQSSIPTKPNDFEARHSAAVFLIIYSLIGLDTMSIKDEAERQKMTAAWIAWGVTFMLLAFFIIAPEQDAIAKRKRQAATPPSAHHR